MKYSGQIMFIILGLLYVLVVKHDIDSDMEYRSYGYSCKKSGGIVVFDGDIRECLVKPQL